MQAIRAYGQFRETSPRNARLAVIPTDRASHRGQVSMHTRHGLRRSTYDVYCMFYVYIIIVIVIFNTRTYAPPRDAGHTILLINKKIIRLMRVVGTRLVSAAVAIAHFLLDLVHTRHSIINIIFCIYIVFIIIYYCTFI